jgi:glutamate 5-kinase
MKTSRKYREVLRDARRIVVKIGTRVLVQKNGRQEKQRMRALVRDIAGLRRGGREVVIVTSGAIGAGMEALGITTRPKELHDLQMAAAVGQCRLMARYDELFQKERCSVGQVLLTHDNFRHKVRIANMRRTLESLLRKNVIPIINENDVVSSEEIRADMAFGDNDMLSALVVKLIRADVLIILTTVDGVLADQNGKRSRIRCIESITRNTFKLVSSSKDPLSRGGMMTKLKAAQAVSRAGSAVVIADGRRAGMISRIVGGDDVGTFVLPSG